MKTKKEIEWRSIPKFDGWYEVSNTGLIRRSRAEKRTHVGRIHSCSKNRCGYLHFVASINGKYIGLSVHRAVAEAFLGPALEGKREINHKDGNKLNNSVENLEWCSRKENLAHARAHGLMDDRKPVLQYSRNGNELLAEYPSIHDAARTTGVDVANISACCVGATRKLSVPKSTGGFKWEKVEGTKRVRQLTTDGEFVREYGSQKEACLTTGISTGQMSAACNRYQYAKPLVVRSAGGFVWKFKEAR